MKMYMYIYRKCYLSHSQPIRLFGLYVKLIWILNIFSRIIVHHMFSYEISKQKLHGLINTLYNSVHCAMHNGLLNSAVQTITCNFPVRRLCYISRINLRLKMFHYTSRAFEISFNEVVNSWILKLKSPFRCIVYAGVYSLSHCILSYAEPLELFMAYN